MRFLLAILLCTTCVSFAAETSSSKDFKGFVELKNGHQLFVDYTAAKKDLPTVVLVNGLTFATKDYFAVASFLKAEGFGVFLYDAYGMGQTLLNNIFPKDPIKVDSQVSELNELLAKMKLQAPYNLFGLSYGGGVLTAYAKTFPKNVKNLMIMSPYTEVIEESKALILAQIAQTRVLFPYNTATDEELANYFIRQFAYQTYPLFEPNVLENPFKLEGIVKLVQGITPYRPIDDANKLPPGVLHMIIGQADEYVKKPAYDKFWNAASESSKCSYVTVQDSKHKITTSFPYFSARWIAYVVQAKRKTACTGLEYSASPLTLEMSSSEGKFILPEFAK